MSPTLKEVASIARSPSAFRRRKTIRELGGTMPENLPTAETIRMVESREKKRLKTERKRALPGPPPAG
jgi:DNA-damage-inducible protein D